MRFLSLLGLLLVAGAARSADPAAPLRVHIVAFGEYDPLVTLTDFKDYLQKHYRVECSMSLLEKGGLTNLDDLKKADVLLLFARRMSLKEPQMEIFRAHWEAGKPIVGLRTASHAFQAKDNAILDRQVFGGNYGGGPTSNGAFKAVPADGAEKHPVLKDVTPFKGNKYAYGQGPLAETATVLQVAKTPKVTVPVTWTNTYKGGRMLYSSLGAADDFKDDHFKRFLVNALFWTSQRDPDKLKR